jgi:HK97 gp10 family phage protein
MNLAQPGFGTVLRGQLETLGITDPKAHRRALSQAAKLIERSIRSQLRRAGSRRRAAGRDASLPGQPPAVQTRELLNSIGHEWRRRHLRVGTGLRRAIFLEFGTAEILPRPFMRPALAAVKGELGPRAAIALRQGR